MALKNKKTNIEVEGGEILIRSEEGYFAIIPKQHVLEVTDMIKGGCDKCINAYIKTLPKASDYAKDGTIIENTGEPPKKKIVGNTLVFSNPNDPEYKYRKQMYQDSLSSYKKASFEGDKRIPEDKMRDYLFENGYRFDDVKDSPTYRPFGLNNGITKGININKNAVGLVGRGYPVYKKPVTPIKLEVPEIKKEDKPIEKKNDSKTNFEQRIENPSLYIDNEDGTISTHKMISFEADGKFYAAPTIVEKEKGKLVQLSNEEAIKYAFENKEFKEFQTDEEAKAYAEGGYKKGTKMETFDPIADKKKADEKALEDKLNTVVNGTSIWLNNTTPMLTYNLGTPQEKTVQLDINSPEVAEFYKQQGNKIVTDKITQEQLDLLLNKTKKEEKKK